MGKEHMQDDQEQQKDHPGQGQASSVPDTMGGYRLTTTYEGATAFQVDDPLVRLIFNYGSFITQADTYYSNPDQAMMGFIDAVTRASSVHPELALQYAAWLRDPRRGKGNRSQPPWVLAVLSSFPTCLEHPRFSELVAMCIVRPDDALNIIQAATVFLGDNKLPPQLKRGVALGLDRMSDYQLAKYANTRLNLLGERRETTLENYVLPASILPQELVPTTTEVEKQKIPQRTLRFVDVLGICKNELSPRLYTIYRYLHAPTRLQPTLLPLLEERFPLLARQKLLRAHAPREVSEVNGWIEQALAARMTMEQIFSATGMDTGERKELRALLAPPQEQKEEAEQAEEAHPDPRALALLQQHEVKQRSIRAELWKALLGARVAAENDEQKQVSFLGDIAFLRNIRGMQRSGIPVAHLVTEAAGRRFAGLWPFQILSAARAMERGSTRGKGKYREEPCPQVLPVLDTIFQRVALDTLPRKADGTLYSMLGLADVSGSMEVKLGSQNSTATCMDAAVSFSVAFSYTTHTEQSGGLAGTWDNTFHPALADPGEGAMSLVRKVYKSGGLGGGTQVFGSLISLMGWLLKHPQTPRPEVLVVLSDMQFHPPARIEQSQLSILPQRYQKLVEHPRFKRMPPLAAAIVLYREVIGSDISLVLWNLAAYEGSPVQSGLERVLLLSGFDSNSFRIIEQWLRSGSPGSAMPALPAQGERNSSSFETVLAALRTY